MKKKNQAINLQKSQAALKILYSSLRKSFIFSLHSSFYVVALLIFFPHSLQKLSSSWKILTISDLSAIWKINPQDLHKKG